MPTLPLVSHLSPDSIIAHRADGAVTRQQFLYEVAQLAALFPAGGHLLNMCSDRYRFSVGLAAAILAGKVSLLPSTQTPEVVRQITLFAPDVFCLTDSDLCTVDLPQLPLPGHEHVPAGRNCNSANKNHAAHRGGIYLRLNRHPATASKNLGFTGWQRTGGGAAAGGVARLHPDWHRTATTHVRI